MKEIEIFNKRISLTKDNVFALLISVMFCHYTLFDYFAVLISKIPIISFLRYLFFPVLYTLLILMSFRSSRFKYVRVTDGFILAFFVVAILFTAILYPSNMPFINSSLLSEILPCIPFFLAGICLTLDERTYRIVGWISCLALVATVLYLIYFLATGRSLGGSHGEDYNMYGAYMLLPNALIALDFACNKKKAFPILCSIGAAFYIVAMGTRGPVIVLAAFVFLCFFRYCKIKPHKKLLILLIAAISVLLLTATSLHTYILSIFQDILKSLGVSTRFIDFLIQGDVVTNTTGRTDIYIDLLNRLSQNPIFGYGVYGEYPIGYDAGAHNIYLQLVFNFGYPLGLALLTSFIWVFVKAYRRARGSLSQDWIAIFGCLVFVSGIFGGNFFDYTVFFLLGLCLKELRKTKKSTLKY